MSIMDDAVRRSFSQSARMMGFVADDGPLGVTEEDGPGSAYAPLPRRPGGGGADAARRESAAALAAAAAAVLNARPPPARQAAPPTAPTAPLPQGGGDPASGVPAAGALTPAEQVFVENAVAVRRVEIPGEVRVRGAW